MLSIAIPTMRRWDFLKDILPVFLDHPAIVKVVLCDETGEDAAAASAHPKLHVVVNEKRLGIYQNKRKAFQIAAESAPYVGILDSDNYFSEEWIDHVVDMLKESPDAKTLYASADFKNVVISTGEVTYPCKHFSGLRLDAGSWNSVFSKPKCANLLNDGNWVVPSTCVRLLPETVTSDSLHAADAIYMLRCFVKGGYSIYYVPELSYIHTVHDGSSWLNTEKESMKVLNSTNWRL
jgi:glycosyltransferase involved in cell wall biosynthesis